MSPSARVERTEGGALITVEDAEGVTEAEVMDGVSPQVFMDSLDGYLMLTVTDAEGAHSAMIPHGNKGDPGEPGEDGVGCTHSWDGTVLTVTSESGTSSADLVGPVGPAGPRVCQLWADKTRKLSWRNETQGVNYPEGILAVGDHVVCGNAALVRIDSIRNLGNGYDLADVTYIADLGSDRLGLCEGAELSTEKSAGVFTVEKPRLREDDLVLSTDTGWLGTVTSLITMKPEKGQCYLKGIARFAMRDYVDGELEKLAAPDLSAYATREWVQGLFDALPDLTGVAF